MNFALSFTFFLLIISLRVCVFMAPRVFFVLFFFTLWNDPIPTDWHFDSHVCGSCVSVVHPPLPPPLHLRRNCRAFEPAHRDGHRLMNFPNPIVRCLNTRLDSLPIFSRRSINNIRNYLKSKDSHPSQKRILYVRTYVCYKITVFLTYLNFFYQI